MTLSELCRHYWLLGVLADLPRDKAVCKSCGATKIFHLAIPESTYDDLRAWRDKVMDGNKEIRAYVAQRRKQQV